MNVTHWEGRNVIKPQFSLRVVESQDRSLLIRVINNITIRCILVVVVTSFRVVRLSRVIGISLNANWRKGGVVDRSDVSRR